MNAQEIIERVGVISSYITDDEIRTYYDVASKLLPQSYIIDVGTGWGKSAVALSFSNPEADVWTFDTGEYPVARSYTATMESYGDTIRLLFGAFGLKNLHFVQQNAKEATQPTNVSLAHFDIDDIELEPLKAIFENWESKMAKDGKILIRNYQLEGRNERRAVEEVFANWKKKMIGSLLLMER